MLPYQRGGHLSLIATFFPTTVALLLTQYPTNMQVLLKKNPPSNRSAITTGRGELLISGCWTFVSLFKRVHFLVLPKKNEMDISGD